MKNSKAVLKADDERAGEIAVHREISVSEPTDPATVTIAEAATLQLSPGQQAAIVLLTSGHSRRDAAVAAGVDRRTLYRWMNDDVHFQAAFNSWQRDISNTVQSQLLAATQDAVTTVIKSIRNGNSKLAWELLKSHGMTGRPRVGPTDAMELAREQQLDKKKKDLEGRQEKQDMWLQGMTTFDGLGDGE